MPIILVNVIKNPFFFSLTYKIKPHVTKKQIIQELHFTNIIV